MLHNTKGIVLRNVKYGETSIIVSVFTELLGLQSYLINGVRTASKKGSNKSSLFQPAAILDLISYHNEFKNLQRLKEYKWDYLYQNIFSDVLKNAVAVFMIELLNKCLKQPEPQPDLFYFTEDALHHVDSSNERVTANFPIYFALHLPVFFGFRINDEFSEDKHYLDLEEGNFIDHQPVHQNYLDGKEAQIISHILKIMHPAELEELSMNQEMRRRIMNAIEDFYFFHVPEFGRMKTIPILREILS
ncbi:MAG TPA: DNA repair protein RecO [Flavisolibacter sp.]|nr:DNA repair protein RecO [Flavisolibacter sp.]